jgi:hypothetical protein
LTRIAVAVVIDAPPSVVWATVERVEDGRPMRARYELDVPLDDPSVALLVQTVIGLKPVVISSRASSTAFSKCSTGFSAPKAADVTLDCGVYS